MCVYSHSESLQVQYKLAVAKVPSLVPRLPRSGMQTLKFCSCGEPGIFNHVKGTKCGEGVERP